MMKKICFLAFIIISSIYTSNAAHIIGGDLRVEWISQNQYKIHAKIYRDNNSTSTAPMPTNLLVGIYEIGTNSQTDVITAPLISSSFVSLGDPCYTPDPNQVEIEEGIYESAIITIPNFVDGYYLQAEVFARNYLSTNLNITPATPQGMTFYCEIPDPLLGNNSSPIFANYPPDAYFCVNTIKTFNFNISDPDGDSLVYTLTTPLRSVNTGATTPFINTFAGTGAYPYYPLVPWSATFSLSNIIGGVPMSIDVVTGDITASPAQLGFYTFAIRVEEFRNGVKIGEVRRDIQYGSLNCTGGSLPNFLNSEPTPGQTIEIPYNKLYCKDLIFNDANTLDTLYIEMISPIFDSGAFKTDPVPDVNGNLHYFYNYNGSIWTDSVVTPPNTYDNTVGAEFNIGIVANRFCWTPKCDQMGGTFPFKVRAFSIGCAGLSLDSIEFNIEVTPTTVEFGSINNVSIPYGEEYCQDLSFQNYDIVDSLKMNITSDIFNHGAYYPNVSNNYMYNDSLTTQVPNGGINTNNIATRFCWTPDCEQIGNVYNVKSILTSIDCPTGISDTMLFDIMVTPPLDSLELIPNVFTPNEDGINDTYHIAGISNPCSDNISVEIYSRWGTKVFESSVPTFNWDGKSTNGQKVSAGTYFIIIKGTFGNEVIDIEKRTVTVLN